MKEEYPEKIYATYNKECGKWNEFDATANSDEITEDFVEYIRADLVKNLLDKEFKRGVIEGERIAANDEWHKYPDEKPEYTDKNVKYLVTVKDDRGRIDIVFTKWQQFVYDNEPHWDFISSFYDERYDTVLAWQELPEPYKED